jgi:Icc protein
MLKIVHLTDIHLLANIESELHGVNPYTNFKEIVADLELVTDIDCIIITGDIANLGEYDAYFHANLILQNINVPIFWIQGNHDYSEVMLQIANKVKIKTDKSFIIKDTKFILLQSVMRDEADLTKNKTRGFLYDYEISFLKRELDEDNFKHCIIALHHPPILSNTWADWRGLLNRDAFTSIVEKYPKVKIVLYGHQHITQQTMINGITYISSPPTSYQYKSDVDELSVINDKQGYCIICIDESGNVNIKMSYTKLQGSV